MIDSATVLLIGTDGEQLGVLEKDKALATAASEGLDLVEVAANVSPPVCRIMDYGHFRYQQSKRQNETKKHQKTIQLKEIKIRPKTETHDVQFKLRHAISFLQEGHKVKITMMFRGREMHYQDNGRRLMAHFMSEIGERAVIENPLHMEGRFLSTMLSPNKSFKASEAAKSANAKKQEATQEQQPAAAIAPKPSAAKEEAPSAQAPGEKVTEEETIEAITERGIEKAIEAITEQRVEEAIEVVTRDLAERGIEAGIAKAAKPSVKTAAQAGTTKKAVTKTAGKKPAVKKEAIKEAVVKEAGKKPAVKKEAIKEAVVKEAVVKEAGKKPVVKDAAVKEAGKKPAVKKEAIKEAAAKEAGKKPATKKPAAKKASPQDASE